MEKKIGWIQFYFVLKRHTLIITRVRFPELSDNRNDCFARSN